MIKSTPGFTGADLENRRTRQPGAANKKRIEMEEIQLRQRRRSEKKQVMSEKEKKHGIP